MPHRKALYQYWERLSIFLGHRAKRICAIAGEAVEAHPGPQRELSAMQAHWYASLGRGAPDYSIYQRDMYLAEVWYCWAVYSRKYLRELRAQGVLRGVRSIADLGCGAGYSTAALSCIAPHAEVTGTNVLDGAQGQLCRSMALEYGFELQPDVRQVGPVDAVFASEYFEHFPAPIQHLHEVLQHCRPRLLIVANTFNSPAIGHFPKYEVNRALCTGPETGRAFSAVLRAAGYQRQRNIKMWNNRPAIWAKEQAHHGSSNDDARQADV